MKIRLIGAGYNFCRHPLVPVSLLVQPSDGGNVVINCPPQMSAKLESINMSLDSVDVWALTSTDVFRSGGIEEVCNTPLKSSTVITAGTALMMQLKKKFNISRGVNGKIKEVSSSFICVADEHYEERITYGRSANEVVFENSRIVVVDLSTIHRHAEWANLILFDVSSGSSDLSVEIDFLRDLPVYVQQKVWIVGYGNKYSEIEDPFPMMFMPQGTCVFDSERKDRYISKEKFIWDDGKRVAGNASSLAKRPEGSV